MKQDALAKINSKFVVFRHYINLNPVTRFLTGSDEGTEKAVQSKHSVLHFWTSITGTL